MNQIDLWSGGQQTNRGTKYIDINSEKYNNINCKLLCVVCNEIQFKKTKKKVVELVYSFKNNKDVIDYVQMWETKLELIEKEQKQIF
jgi:hypothetical protein